MLAIERHREILNRLNIQGAIKTTKLAQEFNVTEETIRRDLEQLENQNLLVRQHGGAVSIEISRIELPHSTRTSLNRDAKVAIAKAASALVNAGDTILVDGSSTCLIFLQELTAFPVTLVTYGHDAARYAIGNAGFTVIQLGGMFDPITQSYVGALTEEALKHRRIDKFFFSSKAVDFDWGCSEVNEEQARLKRAMMRAARESYLLSDYTKFGARSNFLHTPIHGLTGIVTDQALGDEAMQMLQQDNVKLFLP